jgi:hypothetical protein
MFTRGFFMQKTKSCLFFENEFHHAFLYENCAGCAICKSHLAVLVAICKLQLAVRKKASKKPRRNVDEIDHWCHYYKNDFCCCSCKLECLSLECFLG